MKTYRGMVSPLTDQMTVTVDGRPLDPRFDIHQYAPSGFAWGDSSAGADQLAFALLMDHHGDEARALDDLEVVKHTLVAGLAAGEPWVFTTLEIIRALEELDLGR